MLEIVISDVSPAFDGTFTVDLAQPLNGRELHLIKKTSGVRFGELEEALGAGDYDVILAFAVIALVRAGKVDKANALQMFETLNEAEIGKVTATATDDEEEEEEEANPTEPSAPSGSSESSPSSSVISLSTGDVLQETNPAPTGHQQSATGAA